MWFTEQRGNKIGRIDMSGMVTGEFTVPTDNSLLQDITAGPDGNLWFTEWNGERIGRITTEGVIRESGRKGDHPFTGIASGPDGNMWFLDAIYAGSVAELRIL
jgi:virginiamycin B lyase